MAVELAGLLVVNVAYLAVGAAVLALGGWLTWPRLAAAYLVGLCALVVPSSYLALVGVPVGATATVLGLLLVAAAAWRFRQARPAPPRVRVSPVGAFLALVLVVLLAYAARTFAIRPLVEWDAWGVWTAKARLLYTDPTLAPAALRSGNYGQTPYPLGLPTLEALGFGAMGQYDPTLIGLQFLLLAVGYVLALWSLLQATARSWAVLLAALAVVGAPQILYQLLTHYADVPLGFFVGVGLAAGAAWLADPRERWLLGCFALFLGTAGITKSEGFLFALAGAVVLALVGRTRAALLGAAGVLAVILPWRVYCMAYGLATPDYDLNKVTNVSYLRAHASRVGPVVQELWRQLSAQQKFGLLTYAIVLALVAGFAARRWRVSAFAAGWLALSSVGLLMLYWVSTLPLESNITNTSYRTIVSLLVGGASMTPLLVAPRRGS